MLSSVHVKSEIPFAPQAGNASCHGHPGVEGHAEARCALIGLGVTGTGFSTGGWVCMRVHVRVTDTGGRLGLPMHGCPTQGCPFLN